MFSFSNLKRLLVLLLMLPKLSEVYLAYNQINHIEPGTFSNLLNLRLLNLENNKISIVQNGTFSNLPKLATLLLSNNQITVLSEYTDELMSIANVYLKNNPWQCDCRMVSFRQKMVGKRFEDHIICEEPSRLFGQKLKDIEPDDLICDEPQIVTFKMINGNRPVLEGETVILNCDVSGIPTPDITVTLPSGRNATVESGGRVTVEANGIITIENITATESGLYVCLAASPGGSTSANLSIYVQGSSSVSPTSIYVQGPSSVSPTSIHVQGPSSVSPSISFGFEQL
ncbi:PREDICTED: leucine-rich repeat and immunoglobulin-like domain-containing nogo receptor-interacting protein 2 [Branchiostoma belcheri]|uniref:Leucine-rich repeat and immunoglobulin-like domain-containing nogo receptor-interacting protein 2 n=1 Tax=Branchiostoma belcheri TaxID=7741 RepID=A0A6P5ARY3_BRABE|nr:PREDICTED: leucine-rich repeat and immunoglobulin-like domain-containing nogo receptor-interacting protein 2 [Branchiostoma belcheri]